MNTDRTPSQIGMTQIAALLVYDVESGEIDDVVQWNRPS